MAPSRRSAITPGAPIDAVRHAEKHETRKTRKRGMPSICVVLAAVLSATHANAATINWCAIPELLPSTESDFERLAPLVEGATGCGRKPTDSAHEAEWVCEDDPATPQNDRILVKLLRVPGQSINLLVGGWGVQSLDAIRACRISGAQDGTRFERGNVAQRDQLTFNYGTRTLTLLNLGPDSLGVAYTGRRSYGSDDFGNALVDGLFGLTPSTYPTTKVRLAGMDPLETDVFDLVAAFQKRGSAITSSRDLDDAIPEWTLTPPTGLPGVSSIEVAGFARHLLRATYAMATMPDYERFVGLLDGEYGTSRRSADGACAVRYWSAGDVSITGRHCPKEGKSSLDFFNDVASDQLDAWVKKMERDKAAKPKTDKPTIDRDNF